MSRSGWPQDVALERDSREIVLVTGSSGLIGSAVVRRLAGDFTVIGFDKEGNPHPPPQAECVCVDLGSDSSVTAGFDRVRYAYGRTSRRSSTWPPTTTSRASRSLTAAAGDPCDPAR